MCPKQHVLKRGGADKWNGRNSFLFNIVRLPVWIQPKNKMNINIQDKHKTSIHNILRYI